MECPQKTNFETSNNTRCSEQMIVNITWRDRKKKPIGFVKKQKLKTSWKQSINSIRTGRPSRRENQKLLDNECNRRSIQEIEADRRPIVETRWKKIKHYWQ